MRLLFGILIALVLSACPPSAPPPPEQPQLCPGAAATKGPWVTRMQERQVSVFWESRERGCTEVEVTPPGGEPSRIVAGEAEETEVTVGYGPEVSFEPADETGAFYVHQVTLTDLEPGSCIQYRISSSPPREGRACTARAPGDPITFMALGDSATRWGHTEGVLASALQRRPDFAIHAGDLQYYASLLETYQSWFPVMAPLFRNGAFLPAVGNHESELEGEFEDYYARFWEQPGEGTTRWYTFSSGGVHFFSVATASPVGPGSEQRAWLEASLKAAKATAGFRFSVVYFHRPLYSLGRHGPRLDLRDSLEPLFQAHAVRLVIQAHVHGYERFQVGDITWLTTGGGGAPVYDMDEEAVNHPDDVPLRKAAAAANHAVVVTVDATLRGEAISETGEVLDAFEVPVP